MKQTNLMPLVVPHGAEWAIYEPSGRQLLEWAKNTDAAQHRKEFSELTAQPSPRAHYVERADVLVGLAMAAQRNSNVVEKSGYDIVGGVAIVTLSGPMMKSPSSFGNSTSTVEVRRALRAAANDQDVKSILMVVDSPGGTVAGTNDLAQDVANASAKKPCYAFVEDMCCSAAYWVASQASAIFANPTAMVGSIGTYMVVYDASKMYENAGIEALVFSTGEQKAAGVQGAPITEEQRASFQETVNSLNAHFLAGVMSGRGLQLTAGEGVANGSVWIGRQALDNGLVDNICSFDDAFNQCRNAGAKKPGMRMEEEERVHAIHTISREEGSLAGLTLADDTEAALATVRGVAARIADLKADRGKEGRELSPKARAHIASCAEALTELQAELTALLEVKSEATEAIRVRLADSLRRAELALALSN